MLKRLLTIGFLASAGLAVALSAQAEDDEAIEVDYRLWAGGLQALSLKTRMVGGKERYRIDAAAKTEGLIDSLFPFTISAQASGLRTPGADGRLRPETYGVRSRWSGQDRKVEIRYPQTGGPLVEVVPPAEDDNREAVAPELLEGTVDPMTAIFTLIERTAATGRCEAEVAVFDGRRRYDLVLRHVGPAELSESSYAIYHGPATECRASMRRIGGFWREDMDDNERGNNEMRLYLAPLLEGVPPVPVRMTARSNYLGFGVIIHAVDARLTDAVKAAGLEF